MRICSSQTSSPFTDRLASTKHGKILEQNYANKHALLVLEKVQRRLSPWMTRDIKSEMSLRDRLLRKARWTNHEIDWSSYKGQRNRVTSLVKECKSKYHKDLLKESENTPSKFCAAIKQKYSTKSSVYNTGSL